LPVNEAEDERRVEAGKSAKKARPAGEKTVPTGTKTSAASAANSSAIMAQNALFKSASQCGSVAVNGTP
jgi:hypothetical protein